MSHQALQTHEPVFYNRAETTTSQTVETPSAAMARSPRNRNTTETTAALQRRGLARDQAHPAINTEGTLWMGRAREHQLGFWVNKMR